MPQPVEFFFDFSSPYGYIASNLMDALAEKHGRTVVWKPVLLGPIFKLTGMAPLATIPIKGDYVRRDFPRMARLHGLPFALPDPFPFSGVAATRAFYWLDAIDPKAAHALAQKLYATAFGGHDISGAPAVVAAATEIGVDGAALSAAIESPEIKNRARAENDAAVARGVFGSPYFIVDGEPFWGADRLDQLDRWLATGGW